MSKFPFIFLFIPFLVLAENQEKDFRLQQQSQLNQQRQEQQFIQQDKFFTTLTINNQEFFLQLITNKRMILNIY